MRYGGFCCASLCGAVSSLSGILCYGTSTHVELTWACTCGLISTRFNMNAKVRLRFRREGARLLTRSPQVHDESVTSALLPEAPNIACHGN